MANTIKKNMKKFGAQVWELFKSSVLATVMYCCSGTILMMLVLKGEEIAWDATAITWTVVCIVGAAAYHALVCWANGGKHYEMLVSGNVSRASVDAYGNLYKMSNHKTAKEYRVWKGFVSGAFVAFFPLLFGLILGANQSAVHGQTASTSLAVVTLLAFFLSGWSIIPFYAMNVAGVSVSYFVSLALAPIPVIVGGVFYILGAYAKRNKAIRLQAIEDKARERELLREKEKKINYGGLPGTKPKKRK